MDQEQAQKLDVLAAKLDVLAAKLDALTRATHEVAGTVSHLEEAHKAFMSAMWTNLQNEFSRRRQGF